MSDRLRDYCPQLREDQVAKASEAETQQYAHLPVALRHQFSGHEWAWMSDQRKALLQRQETEPEWDGTMINELLPIPDLDYHPLAAEQEMQDFVGTILAAAYPGYRWRVETHPHPTKPFYDIRPEEIAAVLVKDEELAPGHVLRRVKPAPVGYCIKPWKFWSTSSLKAEIIKGGGTCLEVFELLRRAFDVDDWATKARDHFSGLLILPTGVV